MYLHEFLYLWSANSLWACYHYFRSYCTSLKVNNTEESILQFDDKLAELAGDLQMVIFLAYGNVMEHK